MEDEVKEVERRCGGMEGLERPTTIDAKLTTLRGKWKEVRTLQKKNLLLSPMNESMKERKCCTINPILTEPEREISHF